MDRWTIEGFLRCYGTTWETPQTLAAQAGRVASGRSRKGRPQSRTRRRWRAVEALAVIGYGWGEGEWWR